MTHQIRVGEGWDVHALVPGRPLILGGVRIEHAKGLLGHSDADALAHAITDALLGAAGLGDIGRMFPDNDDRHAGARVNLANTLAYDGQTDNALAHFEAAFPGDVSLRQLKAPAGSCGNGRSFGRDRGLGGAR